MDSHARWYWFVNHKPYLAEILHFAATSLFFILWFCQDRNSAGAWWNPISEPTLTNHASGNNSFILFSTFSSSPLITSCLSASALLRYPSAVSSETPLTPVSLPSESLMADKATVPASSYQSDSKEPSGSSSAKSLTRWFL